MQQMHHLVMINVDEICTTSITISLNTYSHPVCGDVSHNVTISGNVIYPDTINGSKYTIDNLHSDALYIVRVTSTYSSGSRTLTQSVITVPSQCKLSKTFMNMIIINIILKHIVYLIHYLH